MTTQQCNEKNCTCSNTECERYGKCCACINHHREKNSLVHCMREIANKK